MKAAPSIALLLLFLAVANLPASGWAAQASVGASEGQVRYGPNNPLKHVRRSGTSQRLRHPFYAETVKSRAQIDSKVLEKRITHGKTYI